MSYVSKAVVALSLLLSSLPSVAMSTQKVRLPEGTIMRHEKHGYHVLNKGQFKKIQTPFLSKELRSLNNKQLGKAINSGQAYLKLNEMENGEFGLDFKTRVNGGGFWGGQLGFYGGKFATHLAAQVAIGGATAVVAIVCPPAATPFFIAAQKTSFVPVEYMSNVVGLAGGIAGAAATGPV